MADCFLTSNFFFFFKQKTAYEIMPSLVGSEMCIRDRSRPARLRSLHQGGAHNQSAWLCLVCGPPAHQSHVKRWRHRARSRLRVKGTPAVGQATPQGATGAASLARTETLQRGGSLVSAPSSRPMDQTARRLS